MKYFDNIPPSSLYILGNYKIIQQQINQKVIIFITVYNISRYNKIISYWD